MRSRMPRALLLALLATSGALAQNAPKDDDFPAPKKITLSLSGSTLKAATDRLAKDGGYSIRLGDCDPKAKVTVKVDKVPFVQALETLCRSAGVGYHWAGSSIELVAGEKTPPSSSMQIGPFSMTSWIGPSEYEDLPFLWFHTDWEPGVTPCWFMIKVDALTDDKGDPLPLVKEPRASCFGEMAHDGKYTTLSRGAPEWKRDRFVITPPAKSAAKLKSVSGSVSLSFAAGLKKTVRFENPADNTTKEVEGFPATLQFFAYDDKRKEWRSQISIDVTSVPLEKRFGLMGLFVTQRIRFIAKNGTVYPVPANAGFGHGGKAGDPLTKMHVDGRAGVPDAAPLAAVEVDFFTDVTVKTYPFEIKDLPVIPTKK